MGLQIGELVLRRLARTSRVYISRLLVEIAFGQFPIFNGYYLEIRDRVPSFLNNEGGITGYQAEVNHEISVGAATARGGCLAILTLRRTN